MNKKLNWGVIGGGSNSLIGGLHRIAAAMHDKYLLCGGVFNSTREKSIAFAKDIGLQTHRVYASVEHLITEELKLPKGDRMDVVSILTPNYLHFSMAKQLIEAGFNVICEKPMTTTYAEALELQRICKAHKVVFGLTHTYTGYPMIRQMKKMIENGDLGEIQKVDAQYYQGWINPIIHDKNLRATTWRLDPKQSGISCCMGDIGVHAYQMLEFVTGLKITDILADLNNVYDDNALDIDGTVLLKLNNAAKGVLCASQIATGEENNFKIAIYGKKASLKWAQENPNYLTYLEEGQPLRMLKPGNNYNTELSLNSSKLPAGHPEGIFDAMANIYNGVSKAINGDVYDKAEFPTIVDGVRGMQFIEQCVASHKKGNVWVHLK